MEASSERGEENRIIVPAVIKKKNEEPTGKKPKLIWI